MNCVYLISHFVINLIVRTINMVELYKFFGYFFVISLKITNFARKRQDNEIFHHTKL